MASASIVILKNRPNSDGTYTIKIALSSQQKTSYITTHYKIDNLSQWRDGRVVKRPDASVMNLKLNELLNRVIEIIDNSPVTSILSASELKQFVEKSLNKVTLFSEYAKKYIESIRQSKSASRIAHLENVTKSFIQNTSPSICLEQITPVCINQYKLYLEQSGLSDSTIRLKLSILKIIIKSAIDNGIVEYKINPFVGVQIPQASVRDLCLTKEELKRMRDTKFEGKKKRVRSLEKARDVFMLSFYCGGINMADLLDATFTDDTLTFIRRKTAHSKQGEKETSITIQPEARAIIDKYINNEGKLDLNYNSAMSFTTNTHDYYKQIEKELNFKKPLMYYSARKTFCQFGFELGIGIHILEYAIGHSVKDASHRPIFSYIKLMRHHADKAIRQIIDYIDQPDIELD